MTVVGIAVDKSNLLIPPFPHQVRMHSVSLAHLE